MHLVQIHAQLLGGHLAERRPRAADVRRAHHQVGATIFAQVQGGAALTANIEPESRCHAAALILAERRLVVRVRLGGFEAFDHSDGAELRTVNRLRAFLCCVLQTQLQRIHAELLGKLIDDALGAILGYGCTGRPVCSHLGPINDDVVTDGANVFEIVGRKGAHATQLYR